MLKAGLAKLKAEQEHAQSSKQSGAGFELKKGGDCTVVLIGLPSVGKSTILNHLTNAKSRVAPDNRVHYTNRRPGLLEYQGAKIQNSDLPGIISRAATGFRKRKTGVIGGEERRPNPSRLRCVSTRSSQHLGQELYEIGIAQHPAPECYDKPSHSGRVGHNRSLQTNPPNRSNRPQ